MSLIKNDQGIRFWNTSDSGRVSMKVEDRFGYDLGAPSHVVFVDLQEDETALDLNTLFLKRFNGLEGALCTGQVQFVKMGQHKVVVFDPGAGLKGGMFGEQYNRVPVEDRVKTVALGVAALGTGTLVLLRDKDPNKLMVAVAAILNGIGVNVIMHGVFTEEQITRAKIEIEVLIGAFAGVSGALVYNTAMAITSNIRWLSNAITGPINNYFTSAARSRLDGNPEHEREARKPATLAKKAATSVVLGEALNITKAWL